MHLCQIRYHYQCGNATGVMTEQLRGNGVLPGGMNNIGAWKFPANGQVEPLVTASHR